MAIFILLGMDGASCRSLAIPRLLVNEIPPVDVGVHCYVGVVNSIRWSMCI